MEADLSRYYHLDYRDRWRFDADGCRRLTLRMIYVRIRCLPVDSATSVAVGGSGWGLRDYLLADLFHATTGELHPGLPKKKTASSPEREKHVRQAKARQFERARAIAAGEIT